MATEEQFNQLLDKFSRIETRLAAIEARPAVTEPEPAPIPTSADTIQPQGHARIEPRIEESIEHASPPPNPEDLSRNFDAIRDKLTKVSIPSNYKLHDSPVGIKQDLKPALKVISKMARHAETGLN